MRFTPQNARNYAELSHSKRRYNDQLRASRLAIAEQIVLRTSQSNSYVEERLSNLRWQILKLDKLIGKARDGKRIEQMARAQKFLNDQERALVRPMSAAAEKASKSKPPSQDII